MWFRNGYCDHFASDNAFSLAGQTKLGFMDAGSVGAHQDDAGGQSETSSIGVEPAPVNGVWREARLFNYLDREIGRGVLIHVFWQVDTCVGNQIALFVVNWG